MISSNAHKQQLSPQAYADCNRQPLDPQGPGSMEDVAMETDFRAGSPCRQAATEIMEDISMETGLNDEAYRRDMINVFPGHPALPQQTHNGHGELIVNPPRQPGAPQATMLGNFGPQSNRSQYASPSTAAEDEMMMEERTLATEPDWITQMLEQVQRVGLWNDPIPEEPLRPVDLPEVTSGFPVSQQAPLDQTNNMDPIPFYKANMESLLAEPFQTAPQPQLSMSGTEQPLKPPNQAFQGVGTTVKSEVGPSAPDLPTLDPVRAFSLPAQEGGVGVIGQNLSTQSLDYIHLIRNALNVPGLMNMHAQQAQPHKSDLPRGISLELSNDGMKEVLASTRQDQRNDGPFRPPTTARSRHTLAGMRSLDSNAARPVLQQSKLQLELGLAADAPIDLRTWGYGDSRYHAGETSMHSNGKRSLSPEGLHGIRNSAEGNPSLSLHARPDVSGCTNADSFLSAGRASHALQNSADFQQKSLNSGSVERTQQASDRKSGLSADEATRLESLERYREKKRRRLYTKTIRYHKRKVNADARKRFKGRFVKAEVSGNANSKDSTEQATDPGHRQCQASMEVSDLQTV